MTTPTDGLGKGISAAVAEFIAYRDLYRCAPTAVHRGGNTAIRDIELFGNHFWVDVKSGWYNVPGDLGHSPVSWDRARDPASPETQLDAVAVVVLRPDELDISVGEHGPISIQAPAHAHWYLIPASILFEHGRRISVAAASVPQTVADPYLIDADHPLTAARLDMILQENRIANVAN